MVRSVLVWLAISAAVWADGQEPRFELVDLGTLGGKISIANAVNNKGQVVGESTTSDGLPHAFLWEEGRMSNLTPGETVQSGALDINDRGLVVGYVGTAMSATCAAFRYFEGELQKLGFHQPGGAAALGVSQADQIVGYFGDCGNTTSAQGFHLLPEGRFRPVSVKGASATVCRSINSQGRIVGTATVAGLPRGFAFPEGLPIAPTAPWEANRINDDGEVAGILQTGRALYLSTQGPDIGVIDAGPGGAFAINRRGEMVGNGDDLAYLYVVDRSAHRARSYDLNECIPPGSGWRLQGANGLNDRGWIVGYGEVQGTTRAFLLKRLQQN